MKITAGKYPAPLKIIDVVETGITKGPDQGFLEESEVCCVRLVSLSVGIYSDIQAQCIERAFLLKCF